MSTKFDEQINKIGFKYFNMKHFMVWVFIMLVTEIGQSQINFFIESGSTHIAQNDVTDGQTGDVISYPNNLNIKTIPNLRTGLRWVNNRHIYSLNLILFQFNKTSMLDTPKVYDGFNFEANQEIRSLYRFNAYRISYTYLVINQPNFRLGGGITLNIRQGKIQFENEEQLKETLDNGLPVVPLLNVYGHYRFHKNINLFVGSDFFYAGPPGNIYDLILGVRLFIHQQISVYTGYRGYGGAGDVPEIIYNKLWSNTVPIGIQWTFSGKVKKD